MPKFPMPIASGWLALSALAACTASAEAPLDAVPAVAEASLAAVDPVPVANISLGSKFLEIDDLNGTSAGSRDANLCSAASSGMGYATCPPGLYTSPSAFAADNPNFPGPNPAAPNTLGTEADYIDWIDLELDEHFTPFGDADTRGEPDDIFQPDSCYLVGGSSPSKANLTVSGYAANSAYLYVFSERETTRGQEEHHYFFTKATPYLGAYGNCADDTWLWDLEDGDVRVTVRYQSTSGLPVANVIVQTWTGGDASGLAAEPLLRSPAWTAGGPNLAYVALNVNGTDPKAPAGEDVERDLDGKIMASGLKSEIAIDIAQVFGGGCGLRRTVAVMSTASGSGGDRDDIKDFIAPVTLETGVVQPTVTLYESCDEAFAYRVELYDEETESEITLPNANFDVDLVIDCEGTTTTITDPELPTGTIPTTVADPTACTVTANITGSGVYDSCDGTDDAEVTVYPELEASGTLSQECDGTYGWSSSVSGGSGSYSYDWDFDITVDGSASTATSSAASGSASIPGGGPELGWIAATLTVSDDATRSTLTGDEVCTFSPTIDDVEAHWPLSLSLAPSSGDATCPTGDVSGVAFTAEIRGGSGHWALAWEDGEENADDAQLDATCEAATALDDADQSDDLACSFGLGTGFCADGEVELTVTDDDPACDPVDDTLRATRTSTLDVTPDPS